MKLKPHPYQVRALQHVERHPAAALFLDMGLGKTVVTLSAIVRLIDRLDIRAALVVAPLRVVNEVWPAEAKLWDHTRSLVVSRIVGTALDRVAALRAPADLYLINYENMVWLADRLAAMPGLAPFDMIVFDESSKMKSPSSRRFKLFKPHLDRFHRRLVLTGTPAPESYQDLWSQFYLLDQGERLGKFITHFRDRHFEIVDRYAFKRRIRQGSAELIEGAIHDITLSLEAKDYLKMPKIMYNDVMVTLPKKHRAEYDELERDMFLALEDVNIEVFNAASLTNKCRQYTSGALYYGDPPSRKLWKEVNTVKFDALGDILDDAQGSPVLVAFEFHHELQRILQRWPKAKWIASGAKGVGRIIEQWNAGDIPVLFVQPASVGHGLNLQYGGHILVWLTTTWSCELYQQTVARLYRQGQKKSVMVHHIKVSKSIDLVVAAAVRSKAKGQAAFVAALKAYKRQ